MPAASKPSLRAHLMKNWFAVEAIPIYVIIGGVVVGASWYIKRLATGPNIIWTKNNPTPWNTIKPDEGTKLVEVNHKFDKSYGIRAIDTSVYYGPSEVVLGNILEKLRDEFPRSSYKLMTKCGRYGVSTFDYSPKTIRESVKRSLERLKTDYLDVVYLHDVEFVCDKIAPRSTGNVSAALSEEAETFGLAPGDEGKIRGEGDQKVLDAFNELRKLKEEGLVRQIGITGYPLPTLLRLALLILHNPPYEPIDVMLSYSHLCLHNSVFAQFVPQLKERAKIKTLLAASPLSMGLLTKRPPSWHPAPPELKAAIEAAGASWEGDFTDLALGYSLGETGIAKGNIPLVTGFSSPREVHECVRIWREVREGSNSEARKAGEERAKEVIKSAADPLLGFAFLQTFIDIFQEYFGGISLAIVKDNFDVVYQLLEETLDSVGHPLTTSHNALRDIVLPPSLFSKLLNAASANLAAIGAGPVHAPPVGPFSSPIPWRKAGVKYASNEMYIDVNEDLRAIVNKHGVPLTSSVCGKLDVACRLSGGCWRIIHSIRVYGTSPTVSAHILKYQYGHFVLAEYRYTPNPNPSSALRFANPSSSGAAGAAPKEAVPIPFAIKARFEIEDATASFNLTFSSRLATRPIEQVVIELNLGEEAHAIKCVASRESGGLGRGLSSLETGMSASSSASWAFDSRKKVGWLFV
ncbi:hypothetical protein H1R20_g6863, partial [Candolleomyces eurysporus]